jgi:uncharacterized Fe-S cluster-containing radical SAM superfamily protein
MFYFQDLVIEVTRRCNLECAHCLRGDAQDVDINHLHLMKMFSKTKRIDTLTITGGEPSIAVKEIENLIFALRFFSVSVGNFYIATNGVDVTDEFILAIVKLYNYCDDNEVSKVAVSNDQFHYNMEARKLEMFKFFGYHHNNEKDEPYRFQTLVNQGRAEGFSNTHDVFPEKYDYEKINDNLYICNGIVHLNALGYLVAGCDFSYDNQEAFVIAHVDDLSIESFENYSNCTLCRSCYEKVNKDEVILFGDQKICPDCWDEEFKELPPAPAIEIDFEKGTVAAMTDLLGTKWKTMVNWSKIQDANEALRYTHAMDKEFLVDSSDDDWLAGAINIGEEKYYIGTSSIHQGDMNVYLALSDDE